MRNISRWEMERRSGPFDDQERVNEFYHPCSNRRVVNYLFRSGWLILDIVFREPLLAGVRCFESCGRAAEAAPETLSSRSDNARSCFRTSALCDLFAFLGAFAATFAVIADTISAVAIPINGMLNMYTALLQKWASWWFKRELCGSWMWPAQVTEVADLNG
jgi:hypothetical protein